MYVQHSGSGRTNAWTESRQISISAGWWASETRDLIALLLRVAIVGRRRVSGTSDARGSGVVVGAAIVIAVIVRPVRVGVMVAGWTRVRAYITNLIIKPSFRFQKSIYLRESNSSCLGSYSRVWTWYGTITRVYFDIIEQNERESSEI